MQRQVTLSTGFWMGTYEVTQNQWQLIMGRNPSMQSRYGKYSKDDEKGALMGELPVDNVSWEMCQQFAAKLNQQYAAQLPAGYKFSLPTEAQWEYACRAGSTGEYAGNGDLDSMGQYRGNSDGNKGNTRTYRVGGKLPNDWGLYDMYGNVREWCQDWYGEYSPGEVTDPQGPERGTERVERGGAWYQDASDCRSASRSASTSDYRYYFLGLRLALTQSIK